MLKLYRELLSALDSCYFDILNANTYEDNILSLMNTDYFNPQEASSGATKLVLFPKQDSSIVVKIPFEYSVDMEEKWNDETQEYEYGEYYPLCGATGNESWNYIEAEVAIYEKAQAAGVEDFFLKNTFIGYVHGHPIYVQARVTMFDDRCWDGEYYYSKAERDSLKKIEQNQYCPFCEEWSLDFIRYYGEQALEKLLNFIDEECLDDFHMGNIGYIDDIPVIVDYGGYEG